LTVLGGNEAQLELHEGRFHQVKRMFAVLGALVIRLHRVRFGPFELGDLEPGQWRVVEPPWPR
jgi:16S rRNA pseudouridine516 synthase